MIRAAGLICFATLAACGPQKHVETAQPGVAVINTVPGPMVEPPPPPPPLPPLPPPRPIVVTKAEDLPPAPDDGATVDGWRKIRVGMTLAALSHALGVRISLKDDPLYQQDKCTEISPKGAGDVSIMITDGAVARIGVFERGIATYGGAQVGDKAADVKAKFGAALNADPHEYRGSPAEYLTIWTQLVSIPDGAAPSEIQAAQAADRGLRFETDADGVITNFYVGNGAIGWVEGCL